MAIRRSSFGRTWWGQTWLNALMRLGIISNKMPRGKSFASRGNVRDLSVHDNGSLVALVKATKRKRYRVYIDVRKFSDEEKTRLAKIISGNLAISSELNAGSLPHGILTLLEEQKLSPLPNQPADIRGLCTCPDLVRPCKHIIAVYHIIANEVDKNPFLIFNLRGVSASSMRPAGTHTPLAPADNNDLTLKFIPHNIVGINPEQPPFVEPELFFPCIHIEALFSLLPDNPLFYTAGNFKQILLLNYKLLADRAGKIELNPEEETLFKGAEVYLRKTDKTKGKAGKWNRNGFAASEKFELIITRRDVYRSYWLYRDYKRIRVPVHYHSAAIPQSVYGYELAVREAVRYFILRPLLFESDKYSRSVRYFSMASLMALALVKSFSFVPKLHYRKEGGFTVHYVPLIQNDKIKAALAQLNTLYCPNLIFRESDTALLRDGASEFIVSLFITELVAILLSNNGEIYLSRSRNSIYNVFFYGDVFIHRKFEDANTAKAVRDWLEILSIRNKTISPIVRIEEADNNMFLLSLEIENKADPAALTEAFGKLFLEGEKIFTYDAASLRPDILRQCNIAAAYLPALGPVINSHGLHKEKIDAKCLAGILDVTAETLKQLGINIIIPRSLRNLLIPRLLLKGKGKSSSIGISYFTLEHLMEFNWKIAAGDKEISKEEFFSLCRSAEGIVKFRDEYLLLNAGEVKNILHRLNRIPEKLTRQQYLKTILSREYDGIELEADEGLQQIISNLLSPVDVEIPATLNATLRPYQVRGYKWLYSNLIKGFGSCLADDMGLGKTIQVISLILRLKEEGKLKSPVLVVSPTTLIGNWYKECENFAPSLNAHIYHGAERKSEYNNFDLVITSYGTMRSDIEKLKQEKWGLVIIDEAQNIKNPDSDQSRAIKELKASGFIAMSGTPVENRLSELWSIFDFLNKGYLGSLNFYKNEFALPIEKYRSSESIEKLRRITAPFLMRRIKADKAIIADLPDKLIFDEYCYLSKEQTALYEQTVQSAFNIIESTEGIRRKGLILRLITSLKQICNHPSHFSKTGEAKPEHSGKAEKLFELLEAILSNNEKTLIFTQYKEMGDLLVNMAESSLGQVPLFFHGSLTRQAREKLVTEFQQNPLIKIMVVSLKAGGTGLNLTAATNVIHYDLWWNPAVEAQATDRAYRIGQHSNVIVRRLITLKTFEEKIDEMIKKKKELADITIRQGETWITELSDRQLRELFTLPHSSSDTRLK